MPAFITKTAAAYKVEIFIGGTASAAYLTCRDFCDKIGLCVTIDALDFVYRGGGCGGIRVGLINYARFPKSQEQIWETAVALAHELLRDLDQGSFTVQDFQHSYFWSKRVEDGCDG